MASYLDELNSQQRAAVEYTDGPQLVIAGAGSGKTRVLTYKIMHLLHLGYEPYRILALTFTNKAAREMKERIAAVAGASAASRIWMGTFHSIFLRILRTHADRIGFRPDFTIYDTADSKSLVTSIIKGLELDDKVYKPATVLGTISSAKNQLYSADQYADDPDMIRRDAAANRPLTHRIFRLYAERCRVAQAMDFDDILYYMNVLLRDNPDLCRHYREFFRYILVDEYQDTNFAQHLIIKQLCDEHQMFCAVGDDAQSIYSFRGANISNILTLQQRYKGLQIFKLERNYRSTKNIISAAGSLIEKNRRQIPKKVFSENETGAPVEVVEAYSDIEEAALVANSILNSKLRRRESYSDFAVLYRTNAQSRALEEALRKRNVPYRIYGGLSFYQRREIKDAVCYFRLTVNTADDEALQRIINYPARGIGQTTVGKLRDAATSAGVSMYEVASDPDKYNLSIHSGTRRKLADFVRMIDSFVSAYGSGSPAFDVAQTIYNSAGLMAFEASDTTPEAVSRRENLGSLLAAVKEFTDERHEAGDENISLSDFLSEISLATDQDQGDDADESRVTLMTVHAAKGLEFGNVYIVGVEEELFPSALSASSAEEIEEERRLLYVAITRAKRNCTLTFARTRFRNGQTVATRVSRFVSDINPAFLSVKTSQGIPAYGSERFINPLQRYIRRPVPDRSQPSAPSPQQRRLRPMTEVAPTAPQHTASELKPGIRISHGRFGRGVVSSVEDAGDDTFIIVNFENTGSKKLLLRFAKFDIIS